MAPLSDDELVEAGLTPKEIRTCVMLTEDPDPTILESYLKASKPQPAEDDDDAEETEPDAPVSETPAHGTDHSPTT